MNTLSKYLVATTAGALLATGASAETFNVTAEVANTIALTETTPLNFGNLYVRRGTGADGGGGPATLTLATTGSFTGTGEGDEATTLSRIVSLGGATAGVLSVTGASPFASVTVTSNAAPTDLIHSSGNPALPVVTFDAITTDPAHNAALVLDANGDGDILVGGQMTAATAVAAGTAYAEGTYTGTYVVTVSY